MIPQLIKGQDDWALIEPLLEKSRNQNATLVTKQKIKRVATAWDGPECPKSVSTLDV